MFGKFRFNDSRLSPQFNTNFAEEFKIFRVQIYEILGFVKSLHLFLDLAKYQRLPLLSHLTYFSLSARIKYLLFCQL